MQQDVFFAGGLVGDHDSGSLHIRQSYNTVNVSTLRSVSNTVALGGLVGESGDLSGVSSIGAADQHLVIDPSYAAGAVMGGWIVTYNGTGGLVGIVHADFASISDSFAHASLFGGLTRGGLVGFTNDSVVQDYTRAHTTKDHFGSRASPLESYHSGTLATETGSGSVPPAGWSAEVWTAGNLPTLNAVATPKQQLFVEVTGASTVYGDMTPTKRRRDLLAPAAGRIVGRPWAATPGVPQSQSRTLNSIFHRSSLRVLWHQSSNIPSSVTLLAN